MQAGLPNDRERELGTKMRDWREDRLLKEWEMAALLDVDVETLRGWEDGVGLPEEEEVRMTYRSLETAAGEVHRDMHVVGKEDVVYGITKADVQEVWGRYMRAKEDREAREAGWQGEAAESAQSESQEPEFQPDVQPDWEGESQEVRRGGGRP